MRFVRRRRIERPRWTFILIGTIIVVFILQLTSKFWLYFSFIPVYAISRPWTFVTAIFLHADFSHLFFNMFALFIFGVYLESRIRQRDFLLIFFLSGIVGNLGYMVTSFNPTIPGIGASGAVYGIIGILAVLEPFTPIYIWYAPVPMIFAAILWGITEFLGLFVPSGIAHGSHLGGLFFGILYGLYIRRESKKVEKTRYISYRP